MRRWKPVSIAWCALVLALTVRAAPPKSGPAVDYLEALVRFEPWAESVWKDYPDIANSGYFGDGKSAGNGGIRGTCGVALGYAVLVREFPDAPERARRLKRVEATLRYAALTHSSGPENVTAVDGKKWGVHPGLDKHDAHGWQSPLWAGTLGITAALLEKELDPQVVEACKRVVAAEADVLVPIPPASGFRRDSKCEENAWDSSIPALAAAWMPDDPRAGAWMTTAKKYLVNTYTVPDVSNDPLKEWVTTQTLFPSFAIENHGFYHPFYHVDGGNSMGDTYLMAKLVHPDKARELRPFAEHNVLPVWDFIKGIFLDTGEVAFPSGLDWSLHCFEHCNYLAFMATHFNAPEAQWLEHRLAKNILARQQASGDGRFVGESCPNGFYREAVEARHTAIAYLHHQAAGFPNEAGAPPADHLTHHDDVGLIFHRANDTLVTVSYGARTMALVYSLNAKNLPQQFMISPNPTSLIGGNGRTTLKNYTRTADGFRAELELNSRRGRKGTMLIESMPGALALIEIPSADSVLPDNQWYLLGIENHPFTGGTRTIHTSAGVKSIKERSGASVATADGWLNVDDWLGFVAVSGGELRYEAATKYNRDGAAEDAVVLRLDAVDKPRAVVLLSGRDAQSTAAARAGVKWNDSRDACTFTFKRPDGKVVQVKQPKRR